MLPGGRCTWVAGLNESGGTSTELTTSDAGAPLPSGTYLARVRLGAAERAYKLVIQSNLGMIFEVRYGEAPKGQLQPNSWEAETNGVDEDGERAVSSVVPTR